MSGSRQILAAHSCECSGEIRIAGRTGFVGKDRRIELLRQSLPLAVADPPGKAETLEIDLRPKVNRLAGRYRNFRRERIGLNIVGIRRPYTQILAQRLVRRDVEVMKLCAVVIQDQARDLLKVLRLEFHAG